MATLGSAVASIEFSEVEKDRVAGSLVKAEGLPYQVLTRYASSIHDNAFWARQFKTFNITGFRPVQPVASTLVVKRVLQLAKSMQGLRVPKIWTLYRTCAINYIIGELKELNELLSQEALQDDVEGGLTLQVFTSIRRTVALYNVPLDQIKALYEIWGFERIEGFDQLFASDLIDAEIVSRLIEKQTSLLRSEFLEERKLQSFRFDELSQTLETTTRNLEHLQEHSTRTDTSVLTISGAIEGIKAAVERIESRPRDKSSRSRATDSSDSTNASQISQAASEQLRLLQAAIAQNAKKLAALESIVGRLQLTAASPAQVQSRKAVSANLSDAVDECVTYASTLGVEYASRCVIALHVEFLKHSRVLISHRPQLILNLCARIWGHDVRNIAASPLWTSSSDWREPLEFIAHAEGSARVLVINDFDVGVQEAYLVPALIEWLSSAYEKSLSRIFLVPCNRDSHAMSQRVLEIGTYLPPDSGFFKELARIAPSTDLSGTKLFVENVAHNLNSFVVITNYKYQEEIAKIAESSGFQLPERLVANFINMYSGLTRVIPHDSATLLAASLSVLPWIQETRGESARRAFHDRLKILFGAT
jgi:hypothetical protein